MSTVIAMTAAGVDALTDDLVETGHVDTTGAIILTTKGGADINIGNGVQDPDLFAIGNLSPANDDIIQRKGGVWVNRTMAQVLADLGSDINTIENLSPVNNDVLQRKAGAWTNRTLAQLATDLNLTQTVIKTILTNRTATTVLDDPDIHIVLDPNCTYDFSFDCSYGGSVALVFGWTFPAGASGFRCEVYNQAGTGNVCTTSSWSSTTYTAGAITPGYKASGFIITGATGGTLAFKWGSATAGQTVNVGSSILRIRKISSP